MNEKLTKEMHEMYIHIFPKEHNRVMTLTGSTLDDNNMLKLEDSALLNLKQNDDNYNPTAVYFGEDMINRFVEKSDGKLCTFWKKNDLKEKINFFKVFSYIIFKDTLHEYDIRLYVTYILKCLYH